MKIAKKIKELLLEVFFLMVMILFFSAVLWFLSALMPISSPFAGRSFSEIVLTLGGISMIVNFLRMYLSGEYKPYRRGYEETTIVLVSPIANEEEG